MGSNLNEGPVLVLCYARRVQPTEAMSCRTRPLGARNPYPQGCPTRHKGDGLRQRLHRSATVMRPSINIPSATAQGRGHQDGRRRRARGNGADFQLIRARKRRRELRLHLGRIRYQGKPHHSAMPRRHQLVCIRKNRPMLQRRWEESEMLSLIGRLRRRSGPPRRTPKFGEQTAAWCAEASARTP